MKVAAVQDLEEDVSELNHKTSVSKVWLQFDPYTTSNIGPRNLALLGLLWEQPRLMLPGVFVRGLHELLFSLQPMESF